MSESERERERDTVWMSCKRAIRVKMLGEGANWRRFTRYDNDSTGGERQTCSGMRLRHNRVCWRAFFFLVVFLADHFASRSY